MQIIIKILLAFMKIGAFGFGGGLAILPLIEKEIVRHHQWLTINEFVDVIAIAQMTPGPIAVNSSTFVGYKIAGVLGALTGSVGVVVISFLLVTVLAKYFTKVKDHPNTKAIFKGIRPAVLGLILSAAISVGKTALIDGKSVCIAVIVFFILVKFRVHPILGIGFAGILGVLLY